MSPWDRKRWPGPTALPIARRGGIATVFGSGLGTVAGATSLPLPNILGQAEVTLNGQAVPLFYTSPQQINVQIPWELEGELQTALSVKVGGVLSAVQTLDLSATAPAIFSLDSSGTGQGAILIASTGEVAARRGR